MIITPSIRSNFFTNAHPLGCKEFISKQIKEAKKLPSFDGAKNVLIIGGSSGYGLASRISLAFGSNANTVNVSFESKPRGRRTGSAGWWNNQYFQEAAKETNNHHVDFIRDAFSSDTKHEVIKYIKESIGQVDLVVYSLAAGARKNEETNETVRSQIKTLGEPLHGKTIDVKDEKMIDLSVEAGTKQDIEDTVFVMGGGDWYNWIQALKQEDALTKNCKTIAYTYVGSETTKDIYRGGTLGKAKEDLEQTKDTLHAELSSTLNGEALIASNKAIVSKASVFIPQMPIYVSCLFEVMKKANTHETTLAHTYRLFHDMVYGNKREIDAFGRLRPDFTELEPSIQLTTERLMQSISEDEFFKLEGAKEFLNEFYQINGFNHINIDYDNDIDIATILSNLETITK